MTTTTGIRIRGLVKTFRGHRALDGLDLDIPTGHVVALCGDNGAGKTTLLKVLAGHLQNWSGDVRINGQEPGPATKRDLTYLPDTCALDLDRRFSWHLDDWTHLFSDFDADRATQIFRAFSLPEDRTLAQMSSGMRDKVQIALTMGRRCPIHLLDEPIRGVDPASRDHILEAILTDLDPDGLLVISTHLIHDIEAIADRVVFLRGGRLLLEGDADDLRAEHGMSIDDLFRKEYR